MDRVLYRRSWRLCLGFRRFPRYACVSPGCARPALQGGFGGGQVGYNVQLDRFVVGAVADIPFANLDKTVKDGNYLTETTKIGQFGTARAVAGYSVGRWLPYGTVGLAWADASYDMNCPAVADAPFGGCHNAGPRHTGDSQIMTGLAYGGGLKYAIDGKFSVGASIFAWTWIQRLSTWDRWQMGCQHQKYQCDRGLSQNLS